MSSVRADALVFFGATGDLAFKKIFPSLQAMAKRGNLDVGSYAYHATRKHAVVSAGSNSYTYDANGNLITRNGSSVTWTSFNLPVTINDPSNFYAQFDYAPDRSRWRQVSTYSGARHHDLRGRPAREVHEQGRHALEAPDRDAVGPGAGDPSGQRHERRLLRRDRPPG